MTQPDETGPGRDEGDAGRARATRAPSPSDVGYINAHGTSTPFNDKIETQAIHNVFNGGSRRRSRARSPRSGTCSARPAPSRPSRCSARWSAAILPPTLNFEELDPECDLDYVPDGPREAPGLKLALSNSFGFGGQNASLALAAA